MQFTISRWMAATAVLGLNIIYFLPESFAAALGGLLAALLYKRAGEVGSVVAPWRVIQCPTGLPIKPSSPEAR